MIGIPTMAEVEAIRKCYPKGTFVEMIHMSDEFNPIPKGTAGIVTLVDDAGTVHANWENGSTLGFIPYVDSVKIIEKGSEKE